MADDPDSWNARYEGRLAEEPTAPIGLDTTGIPADGLFLDVACGLGAQAVWAALNGFDVVALERSPNAVDAARRFADEHRVADKVDVRQWDLADGIPDDVRGQCEVVLCQRYRDPALYESLVDALSADGLLVVTVLSEVGADGDNGDRGASFRAAPGELAVAFRDLPVEIVTNTEGSGLATLVARRPLE